MPFNSRNFFIFFSFFLFSFAASTPLYAFEEDACHPPIDPTLPQYIIGYGSLLQTKSKLKVYPNAEESIPVTVKGYQRGWLIKGNPIGFSTTFLGVEKEADAKFNGVLFKVPPETITASDQKQEGYCRADIALEDIHVLTEDSLSNGQFWVYVPQATSTPSPHFPIIQSYVDVFLSGCLEIQDKYKLENYANECIDTTQYWSYFWVNDRIYPRTPNAKAIRIDQLLSKKLPSQFKKIKIES